MDSKRCSPTPLQSITAGAAAGGLESLLTYPTEYIKTKKQLGNSRDSPFRLLVAGVRESGVKILYTGSAAFAVSNTTKAGVRFMTFDTVRAVIRRKFGVSKRSKIPELLAGVTAGVAEGVTVVTPGENLKTKIIEDKAGARRFHSAGAAIRGILASEGWKGMFRGVVPVTLKQASNGLVRFTSYSALLDVFGPALEARGPASAAPAVSGALAGIITVYATMPADVVKTRMQSLNMVSSSSGSRGTLGHLMGVIQESGIKGLWKGTTPRLIRLSVSGAVTFSIYERVIWMFRGRIV